MDYDTFRKTAIYHYVDSSTKIALTMHLLDPNGKGLTKSRIQDAMQEHMHPGKVDELINNLTEINMLASRNGLYHLDDIVKRSASMIVAMANTRPGDKPKEPYYCVPQKRNS